MAFGMGGMNVQLKNIVGPGTAPGGILPYRPPAGGAPRILGQGEVVGFSVDTTEQTVIDGLPADVVVPGDVATWIVAARRVDAWIDKGRQVAAWAADNGAAEASWFDPQTDQLALPDALRGGDVPAYVTTWLAEAPDIEAILEAIAVA